MSIGIDEILNHLKTFFPQEKYQEDDVTEGINDGVFIIDKSVIANILKGSLHDENIVEVELNFLSRVFFCRILDCPPDPNENETNKNSIAPGPVYMKGSYLDSCDYVITTPLEPGMGNFFISPDGRSNTLLLLRIITSKQGYEFGCYFASKIRVHDMPVLQIFFPVIGRKIDNAREFRAKISKDMEFEAFVELKERKKKFSTSPLDISMHGMVLIDPMGRYTDLKGNEPLNLELKTPQKTVRIEATIKNVTKLRNARGTQYCFGIEFDLATHELATAIEGLVALVQRAHLRELSDIAEEFGVNYDNW